MLTPPERLGPLRRMKALGKWLNDLRDYCAALNPMPSHNVQVRHTAVGTSFVGIAESKTTKGTSGVRFRGEWNQSDSYTSGDEVLIRGGVSGGFYIAIRDVPAGGDAPVFPAISNSWVCVAPGLILGAWA